MSECRCGAGRLAIGWGASVGISMGLSEKEGEGSVHVGLEGCAREHVGVHRCEELRV